MMRRQNTRFASPAYSEHQIFCLTLCFSQTWSNRCLYMRIRFTSGCYILISHFNFSLLFRICHHYGVIPRLQRPSDPRSEILHRWGQFFNPNAQRSGTSSFHPVSEKVGPQTERLRSFQHSVYFLRTSSSLTSCVTEETGRALLPRGNVVRTE